MSENTGDKISDKKEQSSVENIFEKFLWSLRYVVILGVIFSALSAIVLFVIGSKEILDIIIESVSITSGHVSHEYILVGLIGAIDFYLIGLVLLIFSFGTYELFISELDIARKCGGFTSILEVKNLDDLKNKILKVIIMVLIVNFFQKILSMEMGDAMDMLSMAVSICLICIGVYFLGKHNY
ncbi:YqhA family protein [Methanoplanus limicola]|uniref:Uncharacterized protein family UPF0114 n=1 Tax=Methanoplanus limicola DSM 2279 TaxID=937775 RepID=H1YZB5_9EURY|nr:YqhA family protein [Methanoplanus limicola]EHQ35139.1 Uncharacterized protein family UPF0114 [Methanoplanus limicola DSM 2279]